MATAIAMMIGGAITNAIAFSGSNFLFSRFRQREADREKIRHDKAVEELSEAHNKWIEKRQEKIDYINSNIHRENNALGIIEDSETALAEYHRIFKDEDTNTAEPQLSDYYTASDEQKKYEYLFISGGVLLGGYLGYKYL